MGDGVTKIPDEFVPLHVHYRRDRGVRRVGAHAELLYLRALAHAKAVDSSGRIEDYDLDVIGQGIPEAHEAADKLTAERLWIADGDGWLIRSWEKWNPGGSSEAGLYGNHVRWHRDRGIVAPDCPHCPREPDEIGEDIAPDHRPDSPPIIAPESGLDRRVEERRVEERREEGDATASPPTPSKSKRGTRLPDDWRPSTEVWEAMQAERQDLDHEATLLEFRDYWIAKPGKDGVKVNWDATWRNWVRRERTRPTPPSSGGTPTQGWYR